MLPFMLLLMTTFKSSMYDISVVINSEAAATAAPIAAKDTVRDAFVGQEMLQENAIEIATTYDKNQITSSTATTLKRATLTAGNKALCRNPATTAIYGHFNENDNNSHKLSHKVAKGGHQPAKMINMKTRRPQKSSLLGATKTAASPTAESILMPKDQLNKKVSSRIASNIETNIYLHNMVTNILEQEILHNSLKRNLMNTTNKNNQMRIPKQKNDHKENTENYSSTNKTKPFDSISHARQELIMQFALKFKQIPRVTYFTCKEPQTSKAGDLLSPEPVELVRRLYRSTASSLMLKVVLIDHLVDKKRENGGGVKANGRFAAADGSATSSFFTNLDWLEQTLTSDVLRQIVVLDLSCGLASYRLLEIASNKDFFNSMYHWLLLEDYDGYIFNRQTEIDDADDTDNKLNSYSYNTQADKSFKEDIVNDSNIANLQVKKLSPCPADADGVFTSGSNSYDQTGSKTVNASTNSCLSFELPVDVKRQQRWTDDGKTPSASSAATDEDDGDTIEKFLEKLNININTELMLAKRKWRFITTPPHTFVNRSRLQTETVAVPTASQMPAPKLTLATTSPGSMVSSDYNSLQEMDYYYLLYDVWNAGLQYGGKLNITQCGNFTRNEGLKLDTWFRTTSTTRRRLNMQLARIRCMVVITHKNRSDTLEEYLTTHYDTHLDSMNRFNFALLTHVRDLFNFSFILSKTSTWGYLKNGKFDGMIGALVRKQADIGGSPIFFRIERAKVIDYTTRTWVARPCFIFLHPRSTKKDRIVFLQPFSNEIWIFLFASGCVTIVLLWFLICLEHKFNSNSFDMTKTTSISVPKVEMKQDKCLIKAGLLQRWLMRGLKNQVDRRQRFALFFESLIFYIGAICQQGVSFSTFFFAGRCIVITSLLFSFAIYQFYSASIVGTLLMEKPKTIRTLRDLIHSSLEIGIEDIVYNRDYFLRTKDPDAQELYAKKVSSVPLNEDTGFADTPSNSRVFTTSLTEMTDAQKAKAYRDILHSHETGAHAKTNEASKWYDPDYGLAKMRKGRFAFHVDVATAYKIIADTFTEKEICDLAEIQLFPPQKMVSIVQKGSPLRKAITYGLRRVTEVGLTDYQRKVWHSPKPRCVKQLHTDDLRVDMQTFTSALLVLIFGYAVSLLILSLEIVHFKLWQRYTTTATITPAATTTTLRI